MNSSRENLGEEREDGRVGTLKFEEKPLVGLRVTHGANGHAKQTYFFLFGASCSMESDSRRDMALRVDQVVAICSENVGQEC